MTAPPRILGLVAARGGSKRLPRKNALPLAGKPLLAWTVDAACSAQAIDNVVLSTDDTELADIGRCHGARVPFARPAELASDTATTVDVMLHALRELEIQGEHYDYIALLQPTSPLRDAQDIDAAIALLLDKRADAVVSVCEVDHPPEWSNTLPADGNMAQFYRPGIRTRRSQDLPTSYRLNGAIYLYSCKRLLASGELNMDDNCYAYIMPRERSVDIDTAVDFEIAELFMQRFSRRAAP